MPDWLPPLIAAPFIGSFLGLLVVRLPAAEPVMFSRSGCRHCGGRLQARDLVPILSWLAGRGRCRLCQAKVDVIYPVVESSAIVVVLWAATEVSGILLAATCVLGWALLALGAIDLRDRILPDVLTLALIPIGLGAVLLIAPDQLINHLIGAAAGFVSLASVRWAYRGLRNREGMGGGDPKLMAAAGAWVSWQGLPSVALIATAASLAATLLRAWGGQPIAATTAVPFGTFLSSAIWLVWLYGPLMLN